MGAFLTDYPKAGLFSTSLVYEALNQDMKLVTTDEKKTVIAEFHRAHRFLGKREARLEVQPAGMGMLGHIILAFVFAENKRRERQRGAGGAGP